MKRLLVIVPFAMSDENLQLRQQQSARLQLGHDLHFDYRAAEEKPGAAS